VGKSGDDILSGGAGDSITLLNVNLGDLHQDDFIFADLPLSTAN